MTLADVRTEHPLDLATTEEVRAVREVLADAGLLGDSVRYCFFRARGARRRPACSPTPTATPSTGASAPPLLDLPPARSSHDVVVSATARRDRLVARARPGHRAASRRSSTPEFMVVDEIVKADAGWVAAMAGAASTDLGAAPCPLSAGRLDYPGEAGRRMLRVLAFVQDHQKDHCWAHPIDGRRRLRRPHRPRVVERDRPRRAAGADGGGQLRRPALRRADRTHPQADRDHPARGAELHRRRRRVQLGRAGTLRVGFDPREGLVLHQIAYHDGGATAR